MTEIIEGAGQQHGRPHLQATAGNASGAQSEREAKPAGGWIETARRKPKLRRTDTITRCARSSPVLGFFKDPDGYTFYAVTGYRRGGQGDDTTCYWWTEDEPLYWMPLPKPPRIRRVG